MTALLWVPDVLRKAGCRVDLMEGWEKAGHGEFGAPAGIMRHHTGGPSATQLRNLGRDPQTDSASLHTVSAGRPGLTGPLANLYLRRDGLFIMTSAHRTWHAGKGEWHGVTVGNSRFIGVEEENAGDGFDPWPPVQLEAGFKGYGAILRHLGLGWEWCVGHKEYALPKGRKIDPTQDMGEYRRQGAAWPEGAVSWVPQATPHSAMLKLGDEGPDVRHLQILLNSTTVGRVPPLKVDGRFGSKTEARLRDYQAIEDLKVDGVAGPKTWASLGVTNRTGV